MTNKFFKYSLALISGVLVFGVSSEAQAIMDFEQVKFDASPRVVNSRSMTSDTGAGFEIPDNDTVGASSTIIVSEDFAIEDLGVTLNGLSHTWAGDLSATLTHLDTDTSVELFGRSGLSDNSAFGDSTNLNGDFSFSDRSTEDYTAKLSAMTGTDSELTGGNFASSDLLAAFEGESARGTWQLALSDNASLDMGALESWELGLSGSMADFSPIEAASVPFEFSPALGLLLVGAGFGLKRGKDYYQGKSKKVDLT